MTDGEDTERRYVPVDDLAGVAELADELGLSRQAISNYLAGRSRAGFPEPLIRLRAHLSGPEPKSAPGMTRRSLTPDAFREAGTAALSGLTVHSTRGGGRGKVESLPPRDPCRSVAYLPANVTCPGTCPGMGR